MTITPDDIAALVLKHYDALPAKRKPKVRGNGLREWVPLAGIVAEGKDDELWTGMKCLPSSKVAQAQGNLLHDWHAEVLAIRAFNRFVLDECKALAQGGSSKFLRRRTSDEVSNSQKGELGEDKLWHGQPFAWREDILLHMYCSEAPCGDASMELIMASQEDATPWELPPEITPNTTSTTAPSTTLPGRAYFSHLGIVRRKPARPDAPPTLSKSCSDKLALHQLTSLLSSVTTLLVSPSNAYLQTLILPSSRYSATACHRAFSSAEGGRMRSLAHLNPSSASTLQGKGGYTFHPFVVTTTTSEFAFSQKQAKEMAGTTGIAPSNLALAWTLSGLEEATLGGVLQGRKQSSADARGASFASRRKLWGLAIEVTDSLLLPPSPSSLPIKQSDEGEMEIDSLVKIEIQNALGAKTYGEMKESALLEARRRVKGEARAEALRGWVRNLGDESFHL